MSNNPGNVPTELISAVLSAAMSGADVLIDGRTKAVFCITPKAAAAIEAAGKGHNQTVDGEAVTDFLRTLIEDHSLVVLGTMPDGSLAKLTNDPNDKLPEDGGKRKCCGKFH